MSIDQTDIIDSVNIDSKSGDVLLAISDHLDWNDEVEGKHLILLQNKINAYLRFIESGELLKRFPVTKDRDLVINLVAKYPLSKQATVLIEKAETVIRGAGLGFKFTLFQLN